MTTEPITVRSHTELNALVAEKVMGWQKVHYSLEVMAWVGIGTKGFEDHIPRYVTDMREAIQVAMKCSLRIDFKSRCAIAFFDPEYSQMVADTDPAIAICLAALKSHGIDVTLQLDETA